MSDEDGTDKVLGVRLVEDWRQAWRWLSVRLMLASATVQLAYAGVPDDLRAYVPEGVKTYVALSLLLAAIIGRLVDQEKK